MTSRGKQTRAEPATSTRTGERNADRQPAELPSAGKFNTTGGKAMENVKNELQLNPQYGAPSRKIRDANTCCSQKVSPPRAFVEIFGFIKFL